MIHSHCSHHHLIHCNRIVIAPHRIAIASCPSQSHLINRIRIRNRMALAAHCSGTDTPRSVGFGAANREAKLFDTRKGLAQPVAAAQLDGSSSSALFAQIDEDLQLAYVWGKGDGNTRIFDLANGALVSACAGPRVRAAYRHTKRCARRRVVFCVPRLTGAAAGVCGTESGHRAVRAGAAAQTRAHGRAAARWRRGCAVQADAHHH